MIDLFPEVYIINDLFPEVYVINDPFIEVYVINDPFIEVYVIFVLKLIIPPHPKGGGGYTVLPLSVCPSVHPIYFSSHFSQ